MKTAREVADGIIDLAAALLRSNLRGALEAALEEDRAARQPDVEPCAGCAKVQRHPGEGYSCAIHPWVADVARLRGLLEAGAGLVDGDGFIDHAGFRAWAQKAREALGTLRMQKPVGTEPHSQFMNRVVAEQIAIAHDDDD